MRSHARVLFGAAAAFNLAVGFGLVFARPLLVPALKLDAIAGTNVALANLTGGMIALFGVAYALVARDPSRHRSFIALGIAGKLVAVIAVIVPWTRGGIPSSLPLLTSVDLGFSLLFLDFLRRHPTNAGAERRNPRDA